LCSCFFVAVLPYGEVLEDEYDDANENDHKPDIYQFVHRIPFNVPLFSLYGRCCTVYPRCIIYQISVYVKRLSKPILCMVKSDLSRPNFLLVKSKLIFFG
jgi:hypothetical protein